MHGGPLLIIGVSFSSEPLTVLAGSSLQPDVLHLSLFEGWREMTTSGSLWHLEVPTRGLVITQEHPSFPAGEPLL